MVNLVVAKHLEDEVVRVAHEQGLRIAVAESLTGGRLAATLVNVSGASRVVAGAVVAYHTALKHSLLGVDAELLRREGPVHPEVARQMARGVREACTIDDGTGSGKRVPEIGVATTGVAGPLPDEQSGTPAGTVWLGLSTPLGEEAIELSLAGTREEIRDATVQAALQALTVKLSQLDADSGNNQE